MICEVLVAAEASVHSEKQNAAMEVCRAMAGKAKHRGSRATAEALLRERTSSLEEAKAKFREDNLALQGARAALDAARKEQALLDAPQLDAAKKSSLVQKALTE